MNVVPPELVVPPDVVDVPPPLLATVPDDPDDIAEPDDIPPVPMADPPIDVPPAIAVCCDPAAD
jgi:hypothetical protein